MKSGSSKRFNELFKCVLFIGIPLIGIKLNWEATTLPVVHIKNVQYNKQISTHTVNHSNNLSFPIKHCCHYTKRKKVRGAKPNLK